MPFDIVKEQKRAISANDGFHCLRYRCDMRIMTCIERQRIHTKSENGGIGRKSQITNQAIIATIKDECKDCGQGKIIMDCYMDNTPFPAEYAPKLSDAAAWNRIDPAKPLLKTVHMSRVSTIPRAAAHPGPATDPGAEAACAASEPGKTGSATGCSICGAETIKARGLCVKHYNAWYHNRHKKRQAKYKKKPVTHISPEAQASVPVRRTPEDPKSAGIMPQNLKRCCICKTYKPLDQFFRDHKTPDGHQYNCKACNAAKNREYRKIKKLKKQGPVPDALKPAEPVSSLEDKIYTGLLESYESPHPESGPEPNPVPHVLTISFERYSATDLVKDFEEYSAQAYRTPEAQALYLIRQFIEEQKARRKAGIETIG